MLFASVRFSTIVCSLVVLCSATAPTQAGEVVATFQDLSLAPDSNGPPFNPAGTVVSGQYSPEIKTDFVTGGVTLANFQDQWGSGYWHGFAYSNERNVVEAGFQNQFSAYIPGADGSNQFGVAFGYDDLEQNQIDPTPFNPLDVSALRGLPQFTLPAGASIVSAQVANTTYAALSMLLGDSFSKTFGGATGNDPDFFLLSAFGTDASGNVLTATDGQTLSALSAEFYLADYRFSDPAQDYVISDWTTFDLSTLAGATTIYFNLSSSDTGPYGMNTPGYFAIDNIVFTTTSASVPEPASIVMFLTGGMGLFLTRRSVHRNRQAR